MPASYTITEGVQITQKIISISDVKGVDRYYDYNNYKAQLTGGILLGRIIGDDISFDLGEGVISSNNAGTHNVATSIVLTGKDSQNYH
ncbi:MAG TPA: YDG domain-containing protein [Clostridia bacterium]